MKISLFNLICSLAIVALLSVSCNSCNDKKVPGNDSPPEVTPTTSTDNSATDVNANIRYDEDITSSSENEPSATANSTANAPTKTSKKPPGKLKGYSAADGTNAENHDGDMYTKHDTTPMPSGIPIK